MSHVTSETDEPISWKMDMKSSLAEPARSHPAWAILMAAAFLLMLFALANSLSG